MSDDEQNRFSARAARYVRVGTNVGAVAARLAGSRLLGLDLDRYKNAAELATALGGLKGPIMKAAQLLSTIPEALPPEYARELAQLQSAAPPMGPAFVRRRMQAELGPDWRSGSSISRLDSAASASLGQVHRATGHDGRALAVKLQYPDMQSAVEADVNQLKDGVRHPRAHGPRRRDRRDSAGDLGAPARGTRLRARSPAHGALRRASSATIR